LDYRDNLEKLIFLKNIELPVQYLSQKDNIDFIINIKLNLENYYR